jgi:hypothetical protein
VRRTESLEKSFHMSGVDDDNGDGEMLSRLLVSGWVLTVEGTQRGS